nr:MAG TPA: hypothetical protein [Caudoviricetes sp.]
MYKNKKAVTGLPRTFLFSFHSLCLSTPYRKST